MTNKIVQTKLFFAIILFSLCFVFSGAPDMYCSINCTRDILRPILRSQVTIQVEDDEVLRKVRAIRRAIKTKMDGIKGSWDDKHADYITVPEGISDIGRYRETIVRQDTGNIEIDHPAFNVFKKSMEELGFQVVVFGYAHPLYRKWMELFAVYRGAVRFAKYADDREVEYSNDETIDYDRVIAGGGIVFIKYPGRPGWGDITQYGMLDEHWTEERKYKGTIVVGVNASLGTDYHELFHVVQTSILGTPDLGPTYKSFKDAMDRFEHCKGKHPEFEQKYAILEMPAYVEGDDLTQGENIQWARAYVKHMIKVEYMLQHGEIELSAEAPQKDLASWEVCVKHYKKYRRKAYQLFLKMFSMFPDLDKGTDVENVIPTYTEMKEKILNAARDADVGLPKISQIRNCSI